MRVRAGGLTKVVSAEKLRNLRGGSERTDRLAHRRVEVVARRGGVEHERHAPDALRIVRAHVHAHLERRAIRGWSGRHDHLSQLARSRAQSGRGALIGDSKEGEPSVVRSPHGEATLKRICELFTAYKGEQPRSKIIERLRIKPRE